MSPSRNECAGVLGCAARLLTVSVTPSPVHIPWLWLIAVVVIWELFFKVVDARAGLV